MTAPRIVAITGYAQVGKDTLGEAFVDLGYKRMAFADPMKELAYALNSPVCINEWAYEYMGMSRILDNYDGDWERAKTNIPDVREHLVSLGQSCRKVFGEDFWINQLMARIGPRTVVTDVRLPEEMKRLKAIKNLAIRIDRPGYEAKNDFEGKVNHIPVDHVLVNDGSKEDLKAKGKDLLIRILVEEEQPPLTSFPGWPRIPDYLSGGLDYPLNKTVFGPENVMDSDQ